MGETKDFQFDIKSVDEDAYIIEGLASVYDVKDLQDDVVERGAFTRTLAHKGGIVPLLWAHDRTMPIGKAILTDRHDGLYMRGELNSKVEKAREALALAKQGVATGLSIGYDTVQSERAKDSSRHLKEIKLYEVSQVVFQACPDAVIFSAKNEAENEKANFVIPSDYAIPPMGTLTTGCTVSTTMPFDTAYYKYVPSTTDGYPGVNEIYVTPMAKDQPFNRKNYARMPDGSYELIQPAEIKSGRTLSAKTRASMMAAIQALQDLMGSTDLEDDPAPEEEMGTPTATPTKLHEPEDTELAEMIAMCRKWRETIR